MCRTISPVYGSPCTMLYTLDEKQLADFLLQNCSSVVGGLSIDNLPRHLDEDVLEAAFRGLHTIIGTLTVSNNPYLTSLSFLKNLQRVNTIIIHDNPMLIDARLPRLDFSTIDELSHNILVTSNPRLHPKHRFPLFPSTSECFNCPHLTVTFTLQVTVVEIDLISTAPVIDFVSNDVLGLNATEKVS
jgi:hypothetical protein